MVCHGLYPADELDRVRSAAARQTLESGAEPAPAAGGGGTAGRTGGNLSALTEELAELQKEFAELQAQFRQMADEVAALKQALGA